MNSSIMDMRISLQENLLITGKIPLMFDLPNVLVILSILCHRCIFIHWISIGVAPEICGGKLNWGTHARADTCMQWTELNYSIIIDTNTLSKLESINLCFRISFIKRKTITMSTAGTSNGLASLDSSSYIVTCHIGTLQMLTWVITPQYSS